MRRALGDGVGPRPGPPVLRSQPRHSLAVVALGKLRTLSGASALSSAKCGSRQSFRLPIVLPTSVVVQAKRKHESATVHLMITTDVIHTIPQRPGLRRARPRIRAEV